MSPALLRLRRWLICYVIVAALLLCWFVPHFWSTLRPAPFPYGVVSDPATGDFATQDFAYHQNYFRQIWHKTVPHPYRPSDQVEIIKRWIPQLPMGLPHAYSPVALVLALPLLALPVSWAFTVFTVFNAVLLLALTRFFLLPRLRHPVQVGALLVAFGSYVFFDTFNMGQTSLLTTALLAFGFMVLQREMGKNLHSSTRDLLLAVLLTILAIKPSVAIILAALLLGERAWRPVVYALLACLVIWAGTGSFYGGYFSGLGDYFSLLNHYCQAGMPPFMQPGFAHGIGSSLSSYLCALNPAWSAPGFAIDRFLFETLLAILVLARWKRWLSLSLQFQGLVLTFLLFCPFLLVTEDLAICLLIAEGSFFRPGPGAIFKVLLVFLIVNLGLGSPFQIFLFFPAKLVLAIWWLVDAKINAHDHRPPTP